MKIHQMVTIGNRCDSCGRDATKGMYIIEAKVKLCQDCTKELHTEMNSQLPQWYR